MDNKVIGNKKQDNKDPRNRQLATSSTMNGKVANQKAKYYEPQNSPATTKASVDQSGDSAMKVAASRAKKIIRKDTSYTDEAIAKAKLMRGC